MVNPDHISTFFPYTIKHRLRLDNPQIHYRCGHRSSDSGYNRKYRTAALTPNCLAKRISSNYELGKHRYTRKGKLLLISLFFSLLLSLDAHNNNSYYIACLCLIFLAIGHIGAYFQSILVKLNRDNLQPFNWWQRRTLLHHDLKSQQ